MKFVRFLECTVLVKIVPWRFKNSFERTIQSRIASNASSRSQLQLDKKSKGMRALTSSWLLLGLKCQV